MSKHEKLKALGQAVAARAAAAKLEAPEKKPQLPLFPELERAIPNHLARSSLFAPIAAGRRKQHDRSEIASREDVKILFSGKQLDMADSDVFMQALFEAQKAPLGERCVINRASFLRSIGRSTGKSDYEWLHESFRRLFMGAIEIEAKKYRIGGTPKSSGLHLVDAFDYDPDTDAYYLRFDPRIQQLFYNREYALIDWDKRKRIAKRVDMAKWLQSYLASHEPGPHKVALRLLKEWMDYGSPMNKFRDALLEALSELQRLDIIADAQFEKSGRRELQAVWTKKR